MLYLFFWILLPHISPCITIFSALYFFNKDFKTFSMSNFCAIVQYEELSGVFNLKFLEHTPNSYLGIIPYILYL